MHARTLARACDDEHTHGGSPPAPPLARARAGEGAAGGLRLARAMSSAAAQLVSQADKQGHTGILTFGIRNTSLAKITQRVDAVQLDLAKAEVPGIKNSW